MATRRISALPMLAILACVAGLMSCAGGDAPSPGSPPPMGISVTPASVTIDQGASQQFSATVTGASNAAVTWSIQEGASGGSINAQGSYTAPAAAGTFHIVATSVADASKTAGAAVTVRAVAVTMTPASSALDQGAAQQFTASVTGTVNQGVTFSVQEGSNGGSITAQGLYVAPAVAGTFHVVATSVADASKTAGAAVTVRAVAVTMTPASSALDQGAAQQFTASVTGTVNQGVTFSIQEGSNGGSITAQGLYTAPAAAGTFHIVATSVADPNQSAMVAVQVAEVAVMLSPSAVGVSKNGTRQFAAVVYGTSVNRTVTWTVQEGLAGGSVSADGFYTAPAASGGPFHLVAISVADPSKSATAIVTVVEQGFTLVGEMSVARRDHTATLLANGEVFVAGGISVVCDPLCRDVVVASGELFDPVTNQFRQTGAMSSARAGHTATVLDDGKVLVVGGYNENGVIAAAELYDPATGTFSPVGSMTDPRKFHTATRLPDGKVFVAGGWRLLGISSSNLPLLTTEVYDPATQNFTPARSLIEPRGAHTATLLADGKVLLAGGSGENPMPPENWQRFRSLDSAEILDPTSGTFASTANAAEPREWHTANLLNDGRVLLSGGVYCAGCIDAWDEGTIRDTAQIFDPITSTFASALMMTAERVGHTATLLPDGRVLLAGGWVTSSWFGWWDLTLTATAELFDPATSSFTVTVSLVKERSGHTATLLKDGRVLIVGGANEKSAEIYQ